MAVRRSKRAAPEFPKSPTGIEGLDQITGGGLPTGRTTLLCGGPGSGKTILSAEFLVRGATQFDEPGVFMAFEESAEELAQNVRSLGFDLDDLVARKRLAIDHVHVERSEIEETGEYDLEALFIRLALAVDELGARRVVLDTLETLFAGLTNQGVIRAEIRRLFRWLKDRGLTAIVTAERGAGTLTRHGLEEYVSDCVILLDHRIDDQVSTRRLRIVKYRGTRHGTNEFPFLIRDRGISVLPITSIDLQYPVSTERVSSGIPRLDGMLGGNGAFRGSSVLVSGQAGTAKTTFACHFAGASCRRSERAVYFALEESESQILRNMRSVGLDLAPFVKKDLLRFHAVRPTTLGLETHLSAIHDLVEQFRPRLVVVDPITNLMLVGNRSEVNSMLARLVDYLKARQITTVFTSLTHGEEGKRTDMEISSLIDTWIRLESIEVGGERNRRLHVLKSRGMKHSNQLREFLLSDQGVEIVDAYLGEDGVLTGSARLGQEARDRAARQARLEEIERLRREIARKSDALEARIASLRLEFESDRAELERRLSGEISREAELESDLRRMAVSRDGEENGKRSERRRGRTR